MVINANVKMCRETEINKQQYKELQQETEVTYVVVSKQGKNLYSFKERQQNSGVAGM